jgi:hypothetical protein
VAIAASSQDSGKNSRQFSGQLACSQTALTDTPSWQLAVLPSVPEYWRCTPTEHGPSLGKPVSSTTHAVGESAPTSTWASRRRTGRQSHGLVATKWCSAW